MKFVTRVITSGWLNMSHHMRYRRNSVRTHRIPVLHKSNDLFSSQGHTVLEYQKPQGAEYIPAEQI